MPRPRNAAIPSLAPRTLPTGKRSDADWFQDIAHKSGVRFAYSDGSAGGNYQLIESVGGGVASFDFDRDGVQDLFFSGGGTLLASDSEIKVKGASSGLFRQQNGLQFEEVTTSATLLNDSVYTHGCTVTDIDADGMGDLVVAGFGSVQVWLNNGDGTFSESSHNLQIAKSVWSVNAVGADIDNDALVDLYLLTYSDWQPDPERRCYNDQKLRDICGPTMFPGERDAFFHNLGQSFEDATDTVGLIGPNRGLGIVSADLDENGFIDFAVVNDVQENLLYLNSGSLPFQEDGVLNGMAYSNTGEREGSMGIDLGDFDRDGLPDIWYANYSNQDNSLMRNVGKGGFVHSGDVTGLRGVSRRWVGFGTCFADFDGDGWDDLFISNGHVAYERLDSPYYQPPQLFRNELGNRFAEVGSQRGSYFQTDRSGRGVAKTDLNNDGATDLIVVHQNEPVAVLLNQNYVKFWIRLDLVGTSTERTAVGAKAQIDTTPRSVRWRVAGGSYLSHSDSRLLYSLEDSVPVDVTVTWLGGEQETFSQLKPNKTHILVQNRGAYVAP
ncbi:MAG: CRTAC1 family protein [Planctomicrobium sp.]|nr:CRTAC1 family protein [Planctomicrobium sp.]